MFWNSLEYGFREALKTVDNTSDVRNISRPIEKRKRTQLHLLVLSWSVSQSVSQSTGQSVSQSVIVNQS